MSSNVTTEIGRASKALTKVAADAAKVLSTIPAFAEQVEELTFTIETKTAELAALDAKYAETLREKKVDLSLKIRENEAAELSKLLAKQDLVSVNSAIYAELEDTVENAESAKETAVAQATRATEARVDAATKTKLKEQSLEFAATTAETSAQLNSLKSELAFVKQALATANKTIDDERAARITIAGTSSAPIVNVGAQK